MAKRFVVALSTGGSVFLNTIPHIADLKRRFVAVVSDRPCAGISGAADHGFRTEVFATDQGRAFSDTLLGFCRREEIDTIFSFYTRLFSGPLLEAYAGRIVNFHPSLLPACPGRRGFEGSLESGARVIGATAHFVDRGMDTGPQILQSIVVANPELTAIELRHRIFLAQCRQLIQICDWLRDDRIRLHDGRVLVEGASFEIGPDIPNLDSDRARGWQGVSPLSLR